MMFLPASLPFLLLLLPLSAPDAMDRSDVSAGAVNVPASLEVEMLRAEVKKLRKTFNRFKKGGMWGKKKLCEAATGQISDTISMELSGLRSQLHTSDSMKSLRSELQYGLTSLRSELDNKVTSVRAELETGLSAIRSEIQGAVSELKSELNSELTDVRTELQYSVNAACSDDKEVSKLLAELQGSLQSLRSEMESRVSTTRAELEQRLMGVRSELEGDINTVQSQFKSDVVTVRSDLQDMVSDVRTEMQDSVAGTRSELQTGFTAAQSGLQNTLHSLQADMMDMGSKATTDVATLRAEVTGMSAGVKAEVQTQLMETSFRLQNSLENLEEDLHKQLNHLTDTVQHLVSQQSSLSYNTTILRQGLSEIKTEAEKGLVTLKTDLEHEVKKLESRLEESVNNVLYEMNDQAFKTPVNVTAFETRLADLQTDLDLRMADHRVDLDTKVKDLGQEVKDAGSKAAKEAADRIKALSVLSRNMSAVQEMVEKALQQVEQDSADCGGSTFVRWGRTECPDVTQLVYSGVVGGSSYDTDGGAANRLCLTLVPQAGNVTGARTYIYGAEYKFSEHHDLDVVCAVCYTPLTSTIMVPGTQTCPPGWEMQYSGHLTAGMVGHRAASQYLCLDGNPESRPGSQESRNGALFYYVFTECGSLPCPPYTNMYVSCVVCSR